MVTIVGRIFDSIINGSIWLFQSLLTTIRRRQGYGGLRRSIALLCPPKLYAKAGSRNVVSYRRVFSLLLISISLTAADVSLKLTTIDGAALKEAGAGQPFLLHVLIKNASNTAQYPLLKNVENFNVRRSGFQMNMVNGATTVSYQHQIRIDEPGTYTLGPAQITEDYGIVESEPITVIVSPEQKTNELKKQNKSKASFLRLLTTKTNAFVGQAIPITLTFYTADPAIALQSLIEPDQSASPGFTIKHKEGPKTGTHSINGVEHRFAQWNWDIYPTKAGTCVIPAYAIDFINQTHGNMFSYFFSNNATKRVYSNTLSISVEPLPPSNRQPSCIGTISSFSAKIEPAQSRVGQGMLLTLTILGEGDFEQINLLPLANMPESLTWYDSRKSTQTDTTDPSSAAHVMEYIVQAVQPGDYQIPPQEIYYFDVAEHTYKTKKTSAIPIHINGAMATPVQQKKATTESDTSLQTAQTTDDILPLFEVTPWNQNTMRMIPWRLFWAITGILAMAWLFATLLTTNQKWLYKKVARWQQKNNSYAHARQQIKQAHRAGNYAAFYTIIMNLLAHHCNTDPAQVSPERIQDYLRTCGLSEQALQDWNLFYLKIAESGFYKQSQQPYSYTHLSEQALYWIDTIEKLPRGNQ